MRDYCNIDIRVAKVVMDCVCNSLSSEGLEYFSLDHHTIRVYINDYVSCYMMFNDSDVILNEFSLYNSFAITGIKLLYSDPCLFDNVLSHVKIILKHG